MICRAPVFPETQNLSKNPGLLRPGFLNRLLDPTRPTVKIEKGQMILGGLSASALVREYGSPLFVMEDEVIRRQTGLLRRALPSPHVHLYYAGKANPNIRIWQLIGEQGYGLDCCSPGEVFLALRAGFGPDRISFTGTGLTADEMSYLAGTGVAVNVDAVSQVERYAALVPNARLGIRINPNIGSGSHQYCTTGGSRSKLGIPIDLALQAREAATRNGATIRALHVHTGSGGLDVAPMLQTARLMFELAEHFSDTLETIDLGGGLGVGQAPDDPVFALDEYAAGILALLDRWNSTHQRPLDLFLEPGQFLVADAGWLLATVVIVKPTPGGRTFAILDTNFNHYLGTALYQSYHEFHLATGMHEPRTERYDLVGNLCNTGDTFAADRPMPPLVEGDLLAMASAGAYGLSRSSNYNSRPIPAEVLVKDGRSTLIRRRQTYEDLLGAQL